MCGRHSNQWIVGILLTTYMAAFLPLWPYSHSWDYVSVDEWPLSFRFYRFKNNEIHLNRRLVQDGAVENEAPPLAEVPPGTLPVASASLEKRRGGRLGLLLILVNGSLSSPPCTKPPFPFSTEANRPFFSYWVCFSWSWA